MSVPAATVDFAALREQTPGVKSSIHFNAAGAALMAKPVIDAIEGQLQAEAMMGSYEASESNAEAIADFYGVAAQLLGCHSEEIAFLDSATRAWDMAFYALPFTGGDRLLTSVAEYASNYIAFMQVAQRTGARIEVIPNDESGQLSVQHLAQILDERVKLVAVTHVPTNGGLVNPAAEIGALTRRAGVPFLLDACQSAGQLPLDVEQIGCDLLSFTGRKYLRGPRGTGVLYARRELAERLQPPMLDLYAAEWVGPNSYRLHQGAQRFECWESNIPGKVGLACAIRYALAIGIEAIQARIDELAGYLRVRLAELKSVQLRDLGSRHCGIVTLTVAGHEPRRLREQLLGQGVSVWYSEMASTRIDMEKRGIEALLRCSVHYYNTIDEIDRFVEKLSALL